MSKQNATNSWNDGLNKDLNPIITPNTVLTDNLNGTFITYNGNEFSLQNDMGNIYHTELTKGFYPIGMTEFGEIAYIVSLNNSYLKYIKAIRNDGVELSVFIEEIMTAIAQTDPNYEDFTIADAAALASNVGLLITNDYLEDLIVRALTPICELRSYEVPSSKFEIGSFPSLDPTDINTNIEKEMDFDPIYRPFYNLLVYDGGDEKTAPFRTSNLVGYDLNHPVSIEIQPSYDGSVNVILTDGKNPPRLINSGFSVLENGKGKFVKRNQDNRTNYYDERKLDKLTRLINISDSFPYIDLGDEESAGVQSGGELKGGNYTFYIKFGDEDGNKTDVICESGIVSIFKGTVCEPDTISGAVYNEITDKLVHLKINNIDTNYSRIYVYYTREYCDLNGFRLSECLELTEPFKITGKSQTITISGAEQAVETSEEELNIYYFTISAAKAIAQQQNMLFLGNLKLDEPNSADLQNVSYDIEVSIEQAESIGTVDPYSYGTSDGAEYYDPRNIYYKLGYWPDELYRFGIVYIKSDGSNTQVFNLKGCSFDLIGESNRNAGHQLDYTNLEDAVFLTGQTKLDNIAGVFKTPDVNILTTGVVNPLYFSFKLSDDVVNTLQQLGIVGYFIVRQKRIPITICQGFGVGIDKASYFPMLQYNGKYIAESFITDNSATESSKHRLLTYDPIVVNKDVVSQIPSSETPFYLYCQHALGTLGFYVMSVVGPKGSVLDYIYYTVAKGNPESALNACLSWAGNNGIEVNRGIQDGKVPYGVSKPNWNAEHVNVDIYTSDYRSEREREIDTAQSLGQGLLSVEAMTNPQIQSMLCGTKFTLDPINKCTMNRNGPMFVSTNYDTTEEVSSDAKLIYIPEETPLKYIDGVGFSTQVGDGLNVNVFGFYNVKSEYSSDAINVIRGKFTPFIGAVFEKNENTIKPNYLYNVRIPHDNGYKLDFIARANDASAYYAVTNKTPLGYDVKAFKGDCFSNTVTIRMHRNFIDSSAPVSDMIAKPTAWQKYYKGSNAEENGTKWNEINIADLNTVSLGHWVTFKCLANSNLGLRAEDTNDVTQMKLLGNPKSFFPLTGASNATTAKTGDSMLLNDGYNASVSRKRYNLKQNVPYDKNEFANRIAFSNVNVTDSFTNGYRVFQGVSYKDYTKQYGSITKLLPYGDNLFCVFEHGIAIIPVNEKALMNTTTEDTIHIYGTGVLTDRIALISQDFGSLWADSIIRTPIGVYGVDTSAKKIWKYTDKRGLETISDMKIQRFLNDNINLNLNKKESIGITNVKTHYNNYKGDVMFTFYNTDSNNDTKVWNLCYNERQSLWITRYSWIPMFSINIDNSFYSMELERFNDDYIGSIWKHGRTGVDKQFLPTKWYGQQHPFEFEFVVTEPNGIHKIFENLQIVSNNVQPKQIEFEFVGDDYLFNKARIYHDLTDIYNITVQPDQYKPYAIDGDIYSKDDFAVPDFSSMFYNARVNYDSVLDEYTLVVTQTCKNIETYGRRLGNIQYKEDGWYTNIEPLRFNLKLNDPTTKDFSSTDPFASAKLRDKWVKIRLKYSGDQLAVVSGVVTIENISYA